jgi:hypothetical protein
MKQSRNGSILIVILFVMSVLGLTAVSFAYRVGIHMRSTRSRAVMAKLECHAASAVDIAVYRLQLNANEFDHWAEPWHIHPDLSSENWLPEWQPDQEGGKLEYEIDYQVIDEEGKLHIAYASGSALEKLGMNSLQIASVFDWMDPDSTARSEGAENEYYQSLQVPYRCKNEKIDMLNELLLVRGITPTDYLGKNMNQKRRRDTSEQYAEYDPVDDGDETFKPGLIDLLTCYGEGKININTAPRQVLRTLPISDQAVDQILAYRRFDKNSSGNIEDYVFHRKEDILQLQGLTETERDVLVERCIFRSEHFRIFVQSVHNPTGLRYHVQVLVISRDGKTEIVYWKTGL